MSKQGIPMPRFLHIFKPVEPVARTPAKGGIMPQVHAVATPPGLAGAPTDLRDFLEALAAEGISATLPTAGPHNPLHAPLAVRTSLSDAVLEEREE